MAERMGPTTGLGLGSGLGGFGFASPLNLMPEYRHCNPGFGFAAGAHRVD
jgi:hypothetical protein